MRTVSVAAAAIPSPAFVSPALHVTVGSTRDARTLLRPPPCYSPQRSRRTPLPATPPLPTMMQDASALSGAPSMRVQLLDPRAVAPARGSATAAGYDLSALEDGSVPARGRALLRTGLAIALPTDVYGRVAPRSGLAWKKGLDVGAGVIDADYRGEVRVLLFNLSDEDIHSTLLDGVDCHLHLLFVTIVSSWAEDAGGGCDWRLLAWCLGSFTGVREHPADVPFSLCLHAAFPLYCAVDGPAAPQSRLATALRSSFWSASRPRRWSWSSRSRRPSGGPVVLVLQVWERLFLPRGEAALALWPACSRVQKNIIGVMYIGFCARPCPLQTVRRGGTAGTTKMQQCCPSKLKMSFEQRSTGVSRKQ